MLGHEGCGAVAAAVEVVEKNASFPGVIGEMIQPIIPAVLAAHRSPGGATLDAAVVANAKRVAARLKTQSPVVQEAVRENKLKRDRPELGGAADGHRPALAKTTPRPSDGPVFRSAGQRKAPLWF